MKARKSWGSSAGSRAFSPETGRPSVPLSIEDVSRIHTTGGSILRTSRDRMDSAREKFALLLSTLRQLNARYLLTIGGDGTAYMARWIEQETRGRLAVVHVPKTIDNDLYLPGDRSSFGYHTARHWGVEIVKNLMEDAKTTGRWYFITTMGRNAGHLALGIGKAAGAPLTLIPEEFGEGTASVQKVADIIEGAVIKRLSMGKDHGVVVLAEGISGKLDMRQLASLDNIECDEAGRIRLSEIQLGRIFKDIVTASLESRKDKNNDRA